MQSDDVVLSIVIVNWNGGHILLDCIESIYAYAPDISFEVIVFDNDSKDGSPERVEALFPQARLFRSQENLGFSGGNNRAFEVACGKYMLILNSDTLVLDDSLNILIREIEQNPEVGILGPRLLNLDGSLQPSAGIFPNMLTEFLDQTMLYRFFPVYKMGFWDYEEPRDVDWLTGACFLVRREVYEQIGGFDTGYFMYLEDVDWCIRAWQSGWKVHFTPAACIVHIKGQSSQPILGRLVVEDQRSTYRFVRKHYGVTRVWVYRLIASLGAVVRSLFWGVRGVLGLDENQARTRVKAYMEILHRSWFDHLFVWGEVE